MFLYTESVTDQTDHFANTFVRKNVAHGYGVLRPYDFQTFTADAILLAKSSVRKGIFY